MTQREMQRKRIYPVILSGGTGSRLWPLSREEHPKQFWNLLGEKTLLQETALRCCPEKIGTDLLDFAPLLVVCNEGHRFKVAEQLREISFSQKSEIILEPCGRSSAPAVAIAALSAFKKDKEAILWVMPADAAIKMPEKIGPSLESAFYAAEHGFMSIFGIEPLRAETGYGYIEKGKKLFSEEKSFGEQEEKWAENIFEVSSFREKPLLEEAEKMLQEGRYLWNSGMFIFKAKTMLEEMELYQPELLAHARHSFENAQADLDFIRLEEDSFQKLPNISIDYAIAEKSKKMAVTLASFDWSDVGSWESLWEISPKDEKGNSCSDNVVLEEVHNSYIRSEGPLIALYGVQDLVVVAMKDTILVMKRDESQNVKKIVTLLNKKGRSEAVSHPVMHRPWGAYESLVKEDRFQVKKITVKPGGKLSLQKHYHRAEHWVTVQGTGLVRRGDEEIILSENQSIYLPLGCVHRLENPGKVDLILIEVQSGGYLGEDDIVRIEDIYARS